MKYRIGLTSFVVLMMTIIVLFNIQESNIPISYVWITFIIYLIIENLIYLFKKSLVIVRTNTQLSQKIHPLKTKYV
jgi:hypothetical protein